MSELVGAHSASGRAGKGRRGGRWAAIASVGLALALVASACGDDDDDEGADDTTEATADAGESTTTAGGSAETTAAAATTETTAAPDTTAAASGEPKTGGSLTWSSNTFPASLDLLTVSARVSDAGMYAYPIYGSLVDVDYATGSEITMNFAESLETSDGGKTWTMVLRDGITFTDGEPYDAEAVKFNWDRYKAEAPQPSLGAQRMESVEVVDPLTLEITLVQPMPLWPTVLGPLTFVGSPKAITEKGDAFPTDPVGAGPFMLEEWVSDTSMTVVRNPDYWEEGRPYLDELTLISLPDPTRRVDALIAGEIDVALSRPDLYDQLEDAGLVRYASPNDPSYGGSGWNLNSAVEPFTTREMRCAFIQSIDKDAMNETLARGNAIRHEDGTVYQEFLHRGPSAEGHKKLPPFDRDAAQAAFDAYAAEHGGPVEVTMTAIDSAKLEVDYYLTQWSTYDNLKVSVEYATVPEVITKVFAGGHQVTQLGFGSGDIPAGFSLNQFLHTQNGAAHKWTGFTSPELEAALDTFATTSDEAERIEAERAAADILIEECLFNPTPRGTIGVPFGRPGIQNWRHLVYSTEWEEVWLDD